MADDKKIKGVVVFFINLYPDLGQDIFMTMNLVKETSKPLVEKLVQDGRYIPIFAPVHNEATRIEKIDFDAPFPRITSNDEVVKTFGKKEKKIKKIFEEEQEEQETFFGFINLFVNFQPEVKLDVKETMNLIKEINLESLEKINQDGQYTIVIVPTTKEASRVQKIDLDAPFPRFIPKSINSQSKNQKNQKIEDQDEKEIELEDEEDIEENEENL